MTNQVQNPNDQIIRPWYAKTLLAVISLGGAVCCYAAAGPTLGVFFGGFFVVTFLTPAAVLSLPLPLRAATGLEAALVSVAPVAIVWLAAVIKTQDIFDQWVALVVVLAAYAIALGGITAILHRLRIPSTFAAALAVAAGLAWLTWPVWMAGWNAPAIVRFLVKIHPALVANGLLTHEPAWTERTIAYQLTNLNQDIPLRLPATITACVLVHLLVGLPGYVTQSAVAKQMQKKEKRG